MQHRKIIVLVALGALVLTLMPTDMFAVDMASKEFGADEITKKADKIMDFLFGPISRFAAILGAAYGMVTSLMAGAHMRLIGFLGIALSVGVVPMFIKGVFTLLMP